ncbi:MAG TPA: hypothetical protein VIT45_10990 [Allosphingosinicella sp.]
MNRTIVGAAVAAAAMLASLAAASPAAACLRTLQVGFEPNTAQVADRDKVTGFLDVPTYGNGQMISIKAAGPIHDLARRRALALSDLLQAHGQSPSGIKIETARNAAERITIIIYPPPTVRPDIRLGRSDPPAPAPATPRKTCGS